MLIVSLVSELSYYVVIRFLQSMGLSMLFEIKPRLSCRLTFIQQSEVKPQAKVG